jgi:AcrR family transcriptional regulator
VTQKNRPSLREVHKERLRQDILDAAGRLFSAEGYQNITFRRIAEEVGYSQSALFYYFKDKEEIVTALCVQTFEGLAQVSNKILDQHSDPLIRLVEYSRAYIDFGKSHPHHYRLVFDPSSELMGQNRVKFIGAIGRDQFHLFSQLVGDCMKAGVFPPGDPHLLGQVWSASLHGVTSFLIIHANSPWVSAPNVIDATLERLVVGFTKAEPGSIPAGHSPFSPCPDTQN